MPTLAERYVVPLGWNKASGEMFSSNNNGHLGLARLRGAGLDLTYLQLGLI